MMHNPPRQTAVPFAQASEIRPAAASPEPAAASPVRFVIVSEASSDRSVVAVRAWQGADPVAPARILGEPSDVAESFDFDPPWNPMGSIVSAAKRIEWPEPDFEY